MTGGEKVPLSGAAGGSFGSDVVLPNGWRCEVKRRADAWRELYRWLEAADVVAMRSDQHTWLVTLPLSRFLELLEGRDRAP